MRSSSVPLNSSTSMKTEWPRARVSLGGCQTSLASSAAEVRREGVRRPLVSQPVRPTGGRNPVLPGGGDSTSRCSTDSASGALPGWAGSGAAQPDSRAR